MHYIQILMFLACAHIAIANPVTLNARKASSTKSSRASRASSAPKSAQSSVVVISSRLIHRSTSTNSKNISKDSVSRAAGNIAQDAGIVSKTINQRTPMADQEAIKALTQRAIDAESDEDNQRQILAAAADSTDDSSNDKIKSTPTVLDELDAITKDASPESVKKNTEVLEDPQNENILQSMTQLSNAALDSMGSDQPAPELILTTRASGSGNSNNGTNDNDSINN